MQLCKGSYSEVLMLRMIVLGACMGTPCLLGGETHIHNGFYNSIH